MSGKNVKLKYVRQKGQTEMCPVKQVKLKYVW